MQGHKLNFEGNWILKQAQHASQNNVKGYWDLYGLDMLTISQDSIFTYSFFDDSPISQASFAYNIEENSINIFTESKPWENLGNRFSVTLKIVHVSDEQLTLLYTMNNSSSQLNANLIELKYYAVRDYPTEMDLVEMFEVLTSNQWKYNDLTYKFYTNERKSKYLIVGSNQDINGLWHIHDLSYNRVLILKDKYGSLDIYQIEKITTDKIHLLQLSTNREVHLEKV